MGFLYSLLPRTKKCCWAPKIASCFAPTRNRLGLGSLFFWCLFCFEATSHRSVWGCPESTGRFLLAIPKPSSGSYDIRIILDYRFGQCDNIILYIYIHWYSWLFMMIHHYSSLFIIIHHDSSWFIIIHHYSSQSSDSSPNIFEASRAEAFGGPWQPNHVAQLAPLVLSFRLPWHDGYTRIIRVIRPFQPWNKGLRGQNFGNTHVFAGETRILAKPWQQLTYAAPPLLVSGRISRWIKTPKAWWSGSSSTYDMDLVHFIPPSRFYQMKIGDIPMFIWASDGPGMAWAFKIPRFGMA